MSCDVTAKCQNIPGSYLCLCDDGYQMEANGTCTGKNIFDLHNFPNAVTIHKLILKHKTLYNRYNILFSLSLIITWAIILFLIILGDVIMRRIQFFKDILFYAEIVRALFKIKEKELK